MLSEVLQGRLPLGNYCLPFPRALPMLHLAGRDTTTGCCPPLGSTRCLRGLQERAANGVAEMPGCVEFGVRVFSECCALESVRNIVDGGSHPAIGAIISQYRKTPGSNLTR